MMSSVAAIGFAFALPGHVSAQANCSAAPRAVQVLGSGGPYAGSTRASTGYLVWRNSDLPALLWLSDQVRQQPLKIAGPSRAASFPAITRCGRAP